MGAERQCNAHSVEDDEKLHRRTQDRTALLTWWKRRARQRQTDLVVDGGINAEEGGVDSGLVGLAAKQV